MLLLDYFNQTRDEIDRARKIQSETFLEGYTNGEQEVFHEMIVKMIESKNFAIYKETQSRKTMTQEELQQLTEESSVFEEEEKIEDEKDEELSEYSTQKHEEDMDSVGNPVVVRAKKLKKLKPSGIVS